MVELIEQSQLAVDGSGRTAAWAIGRRKNSRAKWAAKKAVEKPLRPRLSAQEAVTRRTLYDPLRGARGQLRDALWLSTT